MDKGYWQVELHPDSRKYTCMALDIRRVQWKCLPMGMVVASDIFQKKLDSVYIGLPGVTGIADDMIIFGKSKLEHDRNLLQFLETTRKNGLVLNKSKLQFKKQEVHFFGHRWNSHGITPDPKKIDSILKMEFPKDKETMHSFLGLINFLNRYSPQLAELCAPLRSLILKDAHYNITEEHRSAFAALKNEFRKTIVFDYLTSTNTKILYYKWMQARKDLVQLFSKTTTQCIMHHTHSCQLKRITRISNENAWQLYGAWRSFITFSMGNTSHFKLTRSHLYLSFGSI